MAAKTWESDFRYKAIQASLAQLNDGDRDDLFSMPRSFCVPVAAKPAVGWTPGRIAVIWLVLGMALLGSAVYLTSQMEEENASAAALVVASVIGVSGMGCFFAPLLLDRYVMQWLTGNRGAELRRHSGELICAEISDADRKNMKISIDGDDYVLLVADEQHSRLLIEGIAARYQIRGEDVVDIKEFQFLNYIGAEIAVRIDDDTELQFAIARVSMSYEVTRKVPFLAFLRKSIRNRILEVCTRTLKPDQVSWSSDSPDFPPQGTNV